MSAFKRKDSKEVVIPVPGGKYEERLRDSDKYSEITTEGSLERAVGAQNDPPTEALGAEPESTKRTPSTGAAKAKS
jgi:hypothetical protein